MGWLPAFYSDSLAGYWGEMKVGAERLGQQLSVAARQRREVDLWSMLGRMTMEVTANSAFGCADSAAVHMSCQSALQWVW